MTLCPDLSKGRSNTWPVLYSIRQTSNAAHQEAMLRGTLSSAMALSEVTTEQPETRQWKPQFRPAAPSSMPDAITITAASTVSVPSKMTNSGERASEPQVSREDTQGNWAPQSILVQGVGAAVELLIPPHLTQT